MRDRSVILYTRAALFLSWGLPVRAWGVAADRLQRPLPSRFRLWLNARGEPPRSEAFSFSAV